MKRKRETEVVPDATPSNRSRVKDFSSIQLTPSKTATPRKVKFLADEAASRATKSPKTPKRRADTNDNDDAHAADPPIVRNANRSARRKSVRNLIQRSIREDYDDEDGFDEDDELAMRIYDDEDGDGSDESEDDENDVDATPKARKSGDTGGITSDGLEGGKKGRRKKKQKSPPLPIMTDGYNGYFEQNRQRAKPSTNVNTLPPLSPKTYFKLLAGLEDRHAADIEHLSSLHRANFEQWMFELSQGFSILLYGYGSKRKLLMEFAQKEAALGNDVVIVNGYVAGLTVRDILSMVANAVLGLNHGRKLGTNANEMLDNVKELLDTERKDSARCVTLVIHSVDATALRTPQTQSILAHLAAHSSIHVIASSDHILASLLWDSSTLTLYNFVCHDATTFVPYDLEVAAADEAESIMDIITGGNAGRSGRSGARGVKYVLASLTGNAKSLYRTLVATQLQAMEEDGVGKDKMSTEAYGVEYRSLFQKAMEEFICSSDLVFRTLLKEFYDHQMVTSRKDLQGSELLWAPFRKEELDSILEDLMLG